MKKRQLIPLFCAALAMMSCSDSKSSVDDVIDIDGGGSTSEKSEEYYACLLYTSDAADDS